MENAVAAARQRGAGGLPYFVALVAVLAAIYAVSVWLDGAVAKWHAYMGLLGLFALVAGRAVTGYWRGVLVDPRNRLSLSRLQFLGWTVVVLSAFLAGVMHNLGSTPAEGVLNIEVPSELWVLLGISTASAVGAPALLGNKRPRKPLAAEQERTASELAVQQASTVDKADSSIVLSYLSPTDARWADLLKGDETGNGAKVDLGKLQMLMFTFVLLLAYGTAISAELAGTALITSLPAVDDGLNTLLGISHTGYLASKTISHSRQEEGAVG